MADTKINGALFQSMVTEGALAITEQKEQINELNVFPVPDGDTGTNMTLTIMSAAKEVGALAVPDMETLAKAISSGSLRGARGNSGVILSQLFRGFTKAVSKADSLGKDEITAGFTRAVETAYKAVMKPTEGTILTVVRESAQAGLNEVKAGNDDLVDIMEKIYDASEEALKKTPDLLPVLKEVGVVDSGGHGLVFVLQAFYESLGSR